MKHRLVPFFLALPLAAGCQDATRAEGPEESDFTSRDGNVLEFKFEGTVVTGAGSAVQQAVVAQLQYLQGVLTTDVDGNAQIAHVKLSDVREATEGETKRITYTASLPVAWPKRVRVPTEYPLALPLDTRALATFNRTYDGKCGKNEYGLESFWHDFNPSSESCELADADVFRATATVRPHPAQTTGQYPEYDRIWEDDALEVLGVFGIISSFNDDDGGVIEFNGLLNEAEGGLTEPKREDLPLGGSLLRATRLTGKQVVAGRERTVKVTALLVHSVSDAGRDFDDLYKPASRTADYIYYGGHSGLGRNVASLAERAEVVSGKYQIVYLNGCQTFAYLGTTWSDKKREANGAENDPEGSRDLDTFATALPAYDDNARSLKAIYKAIVGFEQPKTFETILQDFSWRHLNVVFGEEDNRFRPNR